MKKTNFIFLKLCRGITLLLGLSLLTFVLMYNSPIDPITAYIGNEVSITVEQREALYEQWGLNQPAHMQYFQWLKNVVQGDMGISKMHRKPVGDIIGERFIASIILMGPAWLFSGFIGFILGTLAAVKQGGWLDKMITWFAYLQASVPTFWLGLMLLIIFSVWLRWLPIGISVPIGIPAEKVTLLDKLYHLILPLATLSVIGIANTTMHTREKMLGVLSSEYVLFAKTRGESTWQIVKNHGIRNSVLPVITLQFAYFGELFGGSVLAEQVFSYPGLGSTLTEAGLKGDMPLLMGIVLISAIFVFSGNMLGDIINALINPRLQEE